jgi:hypothetical protein
MFMIHTPQTIQLFGLKKVHTIPTREEYAAAGYDPAGYEKRFEGEKPPADEPATMEGTITFQHETDDVSKCQMVVAIEDRLYTFTFRTRGPIVEAAYEDDKTREAAKQAEKEDHEASSKRQYEEQEAAKVSRAHELATSDDTTAKDLSWDAPHGKPDAPFDPEAQKIMLQPTPAPEPNPFERPVGQARNPMMEDQHG